MRAWSWRSTQLRTTAQLHLSSRRAQTDRVTWLDRKSIRHFCAPGLGPEAEALALVASLEPAPDAAREDGAAAPEQQKRAQRSIAASAPGCPVRTEDDALAPSGGNSAGDSTVPLAAPRAKHEAIPGWVNRALVDGALLAALISSRI
eukprot:1579878-Prymnesium_polylepis.1